MGFGCCWRSSRRTLSNQPQPVANKPLAACLRCGRLLNREQEHCEHCGQKRPGFKNIELADLEAVERQLRRWRERGELKPRFAAQFLTRVQAYRRKLLQPAASGPATARNVASPAADGEHAASILARRRQATAPSTEAPIAAEIVDASPVKPFAALAAGAKASAAPAKRTPASIAPSPSAPQPEKPAAPPRLPLPASPRSPAPRPAPPPAPRRTLAEMLTAFMEQRNIRWGELVGGLLIVCSSIALVTSLWDTLNTIPYFQFLIFVSASAAIFGAGLYTEHRWKLESTSRGILIIATLLVPLNFVAMAATARAGWDAFALLAELISLGLFVALVERTARVLTPRWRWPLTWAVVGNSGLLLLARHQLSPVWLTVSAGLAVVCHSTAIGSGIVSLRRETFAPAAGDETTPQPGRCSFGADRANELFILTGVSSFALLAASVCSSPAARSVRRSSTGSRRLCRWPPCRFAPPRFRRSRPEGRTGTRRAADGRDDGRALSARGSMLAAQALAWPAPLAMLAVGVLNFTALSALGLRCRLPLTHVAAIFSLAAVYVTGAHTRAGTFCRRSTRVARSKNAPTCPRRADRGATDRLVHHPGCSAEVSGAMGKTDRSSLLCRRLPGNGGGQPVERYARVSGWRCRRMARARNLQHLRTGKLAAQSPPAAAAVELFGLGAACGRHDRRRLFASVFALLCLWMTVCLAHATIVMAIGLACRRLKGRIVGNGQFIIAEPLLRSAAISPSSLLQLYLGLLHGQLGPWPYTWPGSPRSGSYWP